MLTALVHGLVGVSCFLGVLALAQRRFRGGEHHVPSTDLGLD